MKRRLLYLVPLALVAVAAAAWWLWPEQMVTVTTGKIVVCTEGEIVSDDTREIEVPADKVGKYGVTTEEITCDRHERLAELRRKAAAALAANDMNGARKALEELVELDPSDSESAAKLRQVRNGKKPSRDTNDDRSQDPDDPQEPDDPSDPEPDPGPVGSLLDYVPDKLPGFVGQGIIADPFVLWRDYVPERPGRVAGLVVMAEQHVTEEDVFSVIARDVETYYPEHGQDLTVAGRQAYFGARKTLAVLALGDGSVRVLLEMQAAEGDAEDLRSTLVSTAEEILR